MYYNIVSVGFFAFLSMTAAAGNIGVSMFLPVKNTKVLVVPEYRLSNPEFSSKTQRKRGQEIRDILAKKLEVDQSVKRAAERSSEDYAQKLGSLLNPGSSNQEPGKKESYAAWNPDLGNYLVLQKPEQTQNLDMPGMYLAPTEPGTFRLVPSQGSNPESRTMIGRLMAKVPGALSRLCKRGNLAVSGVLQLALKVVPWKPPAKFTREEFFKRCEKLKSFSHPNVAPYDCVKLDTENKNALYFMPPFKMLSLDKYLSKLKKSLPEDMAETLAVSIAVQLLSGLAYIHDIQNSAHGNLCPSNILLDDEGHVAMNDYNAVREAIGASPPADLRAAQIEDLKAVERIILAITPRQNLVDDVFNGGVAPICLRQLTESEQFIKNSIIPKLQLEGALVSMEIEWTIREKMSDIVDYVEFGESIKTRIPSITTDNGFVKTLSLAADEKSAYPLRRAIGIMQRSYDIPNIIRMFAAARDGNVVHIFTEEADKGSLRQVLNRGLLPQADIPRLLLAVTAQVLNGIIYLNSKLVVSHRDISADNVLLFSSGDVKLYGFGASGKVLQLTDMVQLSHMLLELIPEGDSPELEELRALARGVAYSNPLTALRHDILNPYYNEYCKEGDETFVLLRELKAMGISGMDPMQEIESWRIWDEKNPASDERRVVREKMCKLSQERIKGATNAIRDLLAGPSSLTEPVVPK